MTCGFIVHHFLRSELLRELFQRVSFDSKDRLQKFFLPKYSCYYNFHSRLSDSYIILLHRHTYTFVTIAIKIIQKGKSELLARCHLRMDIYRQNQHVLFSIVRFLSRHSLI